MLLTGRFISINLLLHAVINFVDRTSAGDILQKYWKLMSFVAAAEASAFASLFRVILGFSVGGRA